jgi:hypothetical protein
MESLGLPPETSNFDCLPGRAGGTPGVLAASSPASDGPRLAEGPIVSALRSNTNRQMR